MPENGLRLDKWLWFARFCKSRSLAQKLCEGGFVDVGGRTVAKSHHLVHPGDVVAVRLGDWRRTVVVVALGTRRGPAPEAQTLYEEPAPPVRLTDPYLPPPAPRDPGAGRPTKHDRRAMDKWNKS
ncbi:MAG: RNA-binding S4 domain-containing protein [Alphaproteobacteria bacterium]|nr:RNA-binding S4 domain-containing protein [Alphaproteobacteria bacterium]